MWRLLQCFPYVSFGQLHSKHFLIVDKFDNIITDVNMKGIAIKVQYKVCSEYCHTQYKVLHTGYSRLRQ